MFISLSLFSLFLFTLSSITLSSLPLSFFHLLLLTNSLTHSQDEVRELGEVLGIPKDSVWRHPFPGPGLAIRVLGEIQRERVDMARNADAILIEELKVTLYMYTHWGRTVVVHIYYYIHE